MENLQTQAPLPAGLVSDVALVMLATGWSWRQVVETPDEVMQEYLAVKRAQDAFYESKAGET